MLEYCSIINIHCTDNNITIICYTIHKMFNCFRSQCVISINKSNPNSFAIPDTGKSSIKSSLVRGVNYFNPRIF